MKSIDISKKVMLDVVKYEKQRTTYWLIQFFSVMVILLGFTFISLSVVLYQLYQQNTLDLIVMMLQDIGVFKEMWQDILYSVWDEIPQLLFIVGTVTTIGSLTLFWITRKKQKIIAKKINNLLSYQKK